MRSASVGRIFLFRRRDQETEGRCYHPFVRDFSQKISPSKQ